MFPRFYSPNYASREWQQSHKTVQQYDTTTQWLCQCHFITGYTKFPRTVCGTILLFNYKKV
jgi:hypothetical protein